MKIAERVQQNESIKGCVVKLQYVALEVAENCEFCWYLHQFQSRSFQSVKHKYITSVWHLHSWFDRFFWRCARLLRALRTFKTGQNLIKLLWSLMNLKQIYLTKFKVLISNEKTIQLKICTVFPHLVAAATILFWIHKSLKISYSFLIKFSPMLWKLE